MRKRGTAIDQRDPSLTHSGYEINSPLAHGGMRFTDGCQLSELGFRFCSSAVSA